MASGLQCNLREVISFSPLPQEGFSFLVFKIVRDWVWKVLCGCLLKESAKCHSDFCSLVLQALPPTGAECLWADPCWIVGGRGSLVYKGYMGGP